MTREEFRLLSENVIVLDGATGSNLFKAGMPRGICSETWILEHPEVIKDLQKRYVEAGSRIVIAPTFGANRSALEGYGLEGGIESLNKRLVQLSREAADGKAYVAGDITAAARIIGSADDATYENALERYKEQMRYLVDAGVDLLIIETMISLEEATAAVEAAHEVCDLPVLCTMTVEADGTVYGGGNVIEAVETLQALDVDAVGINCSVGPDQLPAMVTGMKQVISIPLIVKPNAGMPAISETGEAVYSMNEEQFAKHMRVLLDLGANIVGGCCGTTPDYIRELCKVI